MAIRAALEHRQSLWQQLGVIALVAAVGWMLAVIGGKTTPTAPILLTLAAIGLVIVMVSPFHGLVVLLALLPTSASAGVDLGAWIPDLWWGRTVALVIAAAIFIRIPFRGMRLFTGTFFEKAMLINIAIVVVSLPASRYLRLALVQFSSELLTPALVYLIAINVIDTARKARGAMKAMTVSSVLLALTILNQVYLKLPIPGFGAVDRSEEFIVAQYAGTAGNQNIAGLYLAALVPTALYLYFTSKSRYRYLYLFGIAVSAFGCYYTFSRKSWISMVLALVIFLSQRQYRKYLFIGALIVIPIALSAYPVVVGTDIYKERLTNRETIETRERLLMVGLEIFVDNPIVGVGYANGKSKQVEYGAFFTARGRAGTTMDFHNAYLTELIELGLVGFLFFLMTVMIPLKEAFRLLRSNRFRPVVDSRYVYAFLAMAIPIYLSSFAGGILRDQRILIVLRTSFAILAMAPYSFGLASLNKSQRRSDEYSDT